MGSCWHAKALEIGSLVDSLLSLVGPELDAGAKIKGGW